MGSPAEGALLVTDYEKTTTDVVPIVPMPNLEGRPCLIVMRGSTTGELHWVQDGDVLGREEGASIVVPDDEVSPTQCRFRILDNDEVWLDDLGSTTGTFVEGSQISDSVLLLDGQRIQMGVGTILTFTHHDELEASFQSRMYDSALRDPLTGLFNRRYLDECLEAELAFARRHEVALTVCMMDIDYFQRVNDQHGHVIGDQVLTELAERMRSTVRTEDTCCRFGGEKFVVISLGISLENGLVLAERLRGVVEREEFSCEGTAVPVTVSVGVASFPYPTIESPEGLLTAADQALYLAKQRGRNRCKVFVTE